NPVSVSSFVPALLVNSFILDGMKIRYVDQSVEPVIELECRDIRFAVRDFSPDRPFRISMRASFTGSSPNVTFEGTGTVNTSRGSFLLKDSKLNIDLSLLSIEELRRSIPQLKEISLPGQLKGKIKINVEQLSAGPSGLVSLKADGALTEGSVTVKELSVPLDSIQSKFSLTETAFVFADTTFSLGKGAIAFSGEVRDYLKTQAFKFKTKLDGIDLAQCLDQSSYSVKVQGLVSGVIQGDGKGFDPNVLPATMNAAGNLEIKEGRLVDMNVFKMVLDKLAFIPDLSGILEANLPGQYKEKLKQKDTMITSLKLNASLSNGSINIQPIAMEAEGFLFEGTGTVGLDQNYYLNGSFVILQDMASRMVESVSELKLLQDETQQIRFPLKVSGKGKSVSFIPDVQGLGVTVIKNKASEELQKIFDKVFK
ncbi:MAG: AsmA-like C-terminal region-containing protein, partial [Candidatus Omnitrophica bacterium]|nr:AsmA-like C-terminal region-containing protein [Candidatus Omnitrophota bacterium]